MVTEQAGCNVAVRLYRSAASSRRTACQVTEVLRLSPGQLANFVSREMQNLQACKTAEVSEALAVRRNARHKDQRLLRCDAPQSGKNMEAFHGKMYCCRALGYHKINNLYFSGDLCSATQPNFLYCG
jgi:hypothetical protein